ncbi:PhzF family phenazine biosynthesis protein [soil metagenome]
MNYLLIDAFATQPFTGNPAAVVLLDRELDDATRQSIAMEFNQAETAYIRPMPDGRWDLRWFTPLREVPLCGHATLASAHAIWREWKLQPMTEPIRFVTRDSGALVCSPAPRHRIAMSFPATPPLPVPLPANAAEVLRVAGPVVCVGSTAMNLTLALSDEAQVRAAKPDLRTLSTWHATGVTITARSADGEFDFVSRFFAPQSGIDEDPVTGSAYCSLAVYWSELLGKTDFRARQLSPRGGELGVSLRADRVELRGSAITTMRGALGSAT